MVESRSARAGRLTGSSPVVHAGGGGGGAGLATGAAIVAALRTGKTLPDGFEIEKIGLGAGKRDYKTSGFVRAMLISG